MNTVSEHIDLPISAADVIEFRPAGERVKAVREQLLALEEQLVQAKGDSSKLSKEQAAALKVDIAKAEQLVAFAEAEQRLSDPVYMLRVPTARTKAHANRDVSAEGVVTKSNSALLQAFAEHESEMDIADREFVKSVRDGMKGDTIQPEDWVRLSTLGLQFPSSAKIIADRVLLNDLTRIHLVRHHLIVDGQRSPLPERFYDQLNQRIPQDVSAIVQRISTLLTVSANAAKN